MFYSEDEEPLVKKFESYKNNAIRNYKTTLTKFLNLREQELLEFVIGKSEDCYLYFSNIDDTCEYKRAFISPFEIEPDFKIDLLKINYNKKFITIDHRHLLGNIMGLQIERNMIGDILISHDNDIYIVSSSEMSDFLINNLTAIDHQPILITKEEKLIGDFSPEYNIKKYFVASLRVDLIIAEGFNISRSQSLEKIMSGDLKINQRKELNNCKSVESGDLISLKGYGRLKVINIGSTSKSGKILVELGKLK